MHIEDLQKLCKQLPHVTEDIKWGHDLCFCIGEKMFLVTGLGASPAQASFKADDEDFAELCAREGFMPAPYLARYKWVHVDDISRLSEKEWKIYISKAYHLVKSKLPRKVLDKLK